MSDTSQRAALVLGGGRGIGRAIALELAGRGHRVAVAARTEAEVEAVAAAVRSVGAPALALVTDVTDERSVVETFRAYRAFSSRLDVLVHSAGMASPGRLAATTPEAYRRVVDVNLVSVYRAVYHARPLLVASGGLVVNVASRTGRRPDPNAFGYGCSKAAVVYLTRALSMELAPEGVRVTAISPGGVATEMRRSVFPDEDPSRLMTPESVAACVGLLLEPAARIMNGTVIDLPW